MKDTTYNTLYGKLSTGSGAILSDDQIVNPEDIYLPNSINAYEEEIAENLYKMGLSTEWLKNAKIMDVGGQTIAMLNLGAQHVSHYDISKYNVLKLTKYLKENKLGNRADSRRVDLVQFELPGNQFYLAYMHGIVQHFSNPGLGVLNLIKSLKIGCYFWLYFYRSGTFSHF